jgi:hypothetical protein
MGNMGHGVAAAGAEATGNRLLSNSIRAHGGLGIALSEHANHLQEPPVLTSVSTDGSRITLQGTLTSRPQTIFTLEVFANRACHPSGAGEGEVPIGTTEVMTGTNGTVHFTVALPAPDAGNRFLTATATDPAGNTSEYSRCAAIGAVPSGVRISNLTATAVITRGPRTGDDAFEVQATFPLSVGGHGITPLTEVVSFRVGTFVVTLPPGSFTEDTPGRFTFEGVRDGVAQEIVIRLLGGGTFALQVNGTGADLTGTANPIIVNLTIDNDSSTTTVIADIK